jgi:hypothetical protein
MSTPRDKFTTLVGMVGGISLILKAWNIINEEQHMALSQAAPFFLSGIAIMVNGYSVGKK